MVIRIFWGTIKMYKISASLDLLTQILKGLAQEYILCNSCSVILMTHQLGTSFI